MHIKTIHARNLKGQTFDHDLAPITMVTGPNFSGKTARAAAVRLLLLGHVPEVGKTNQATFGLSSGLDMGVSAELSDGRVLSRNFKLKGNSVKAEVEIPDEFEELGPLAAMLDPAQYFALTDRERVAYVFKAIRIDDDNCFSVQAINDRLAEAVPGSEEMIDKIFAKTSAEAIQDFLEDILAAAVEEEKGARAAFVRIGKTAEGTTQLNAGAAQGVPLPPLAELEHQRREAQAALDAVVLRGANLNNAKNEARRARELNAEIARVQSPEMAAALEAEEKSLARSIREKEAIRAQPELRRDIEAERAKKVEESNEVVRQMAAAKSRILRAEADLLDLNKKEHCPYSHAAGTEWRAAREKDLKAEILEAETAIGPLAEALKKVKGEAAAMLVKLNDLLLAEKQVRGFEEMQRISEGKVAALKQHAAKAEGLRDALAKIHPLTDDEIAAAGAVIEADREKIHVRLLTISNHIKAANAQSAELQRIAQAQKERDDAEKDQDRAGKLADGIRAITAELVAFAFEPVLATANAIFGKILRTPIALKDGEIGTTRSGIWATHKAMSGTEQALVYAAISAALASKSQLRVMIVDELGRLDGNNAGDLLGCVEQAIKDGRLDQFIGIDTRFGPYFGRNLINESFKLIEL